MVVFTLILSYQPHVHGLMSCYFAFLETCCIIAEFLLIVAQHSPVDNVQHQFDGKSAMIRLFLQSIYVPFLVDRHMHVDGSSHFQFALVMVL